MSGVSDNTDLFEELVALRDTHRDWMRTARCLVKESETPQQLTRWGLIRWYLHPSVTDTASRALMVWVMEIPGHSRSGRLQCQGGHLYFVWQGEGYTVLDGVQHRWAADCLVNIPLRPGGVVYQHFNVSTEPVRLIGVTANFFDALTVDAGSTFELLEPCPEWMQARAEASS